MSHSDVPAGQRCENCSYWNGTEAVHKLPGVAEGSKKCTFKRLDGQIYRRATDWCCNWIVKKEAP